MYSGGVGSGQRAPATGHALDLLDRVSVPRFTCRVAESGRRGRIIDLYNAGSTYDEIGREFNVTRERVRQLLNQYGVELRPRADRRYESAFPARAEEVEALFLHLRDDDAVADATGLEASIVRRFANECIPDPDVLRRRPKRRSARYSDDELVACLRTAATELENPLAHARYAEWSRGRSLDGERPWPGPQGMMLRFGSWRNTLARAGLPANPSAGPDPRFELSDAVDAMARAWTETGKPPTVESYDNWRAGREQFPASATARKFVEGWDELQLAAWPVVHGRQLPGVGSEERGAANDGEPLQAATGGGPYRRASEAQAIAPSDPFERDPQVLERSLGAHSALQNALADAAKRGGYEPLSPLSLDPEFDLAWRLHDGTFVLAEVKSATASNLEGQLRLGLGQVLRYGETLRAQGENVRHVLAIELEPRDPSWRSLLDRLGVILVTPDTLEAACA